MIRFALVGLVATSVLVAAGCGDDDPADPIQPTGTATSELRALHLSPDAPSVDIFANGDAVVTSLAFPDSTGYLEVPVGSYDIAVSAAGTSAAEAVLNVDGLALAANTKYTAVAIGNVADIQALALVDDVAGIADGQIRIRAIHAAPSVGEVDIWNIPATGDPSPLYENVGFGVAGDAIDLPVGAYTIGLDVDDDAMPDVIFQIPELPSGTHANVFATEDVNGVFLAAQLGDGSVARIEPGEAPTSTANVRVLHLSPDAGPVDAYVDGMEALTGLGFQQGSPYVPLAAGPHDFAVVPAGGMLSDAVLNIDGLELAANKRYTAVAYGNVANLAALALEDDMAGMESGTIRIRAIHAADGVGEVDIWNITDLQNPTPLYEDVQFGQAGDFIDVPAGAYDIGFDVDDDAVPDLTYSLPELPAGEIANVFAVNDSSVFLAAQLSDGSVARIDAN